MSFIIFVIPVYEFLPYYVILGVILEESPLESACFCLVYFLSRKLF